MSGSVWEWVGDLYREDYYETIAVSEPADNLLGPTSGQFFILRGGSFEDESLRWVNTEELLHTVTIEKALNPDKKFHSA